MNQHRIGKGKTRRQSAQLESLEPRHLLAAAPLLITEFVASNDNGILDGDGISSDWIEIHNPTDDSVGLQDWFLSDDVDQLDKWPFPDRTIEANGYLVIFASGQAAADYVDADGNLHTNFKLSRDGEFVGLSFDDPNNSVELVHSYGIEFPAQFEDVSYGIGTAVTTDRLIADGDQASILVPNDDSVDDSWTRRDFNDSNWELGRTGIGYENSPADYASLILTDVPQGTDSAYVRMAFDVADAKSLDRLTLRLRYDDGFIAYLNGSPDPIASANAPTNLDHQSVATGNHPDQAAVQFVDFDVSQHLGLLKDGPNVLAIHALNQRTSSDMLLVPELVATRQAIGELTTGYFVTPTPGTPNTTGVANPGPMIRSVTENPSVTSIEPLIVTADVSRLTAAVMDVKLFYRVMYGELQELSMVDDGSAGDAVARDGTFTATIPTQNVNSGEMIRWYIEATDAGGGNSRSPAFLDAEGTGQSPEYFGTVLNDRVFDSQLPVFQWFTENEQAAHTRSGSRASVYYAGRFYDNVFVRQRGGATNSSVSQKFDFNSDHGIYVSEAVGTVGEINLNGNGSDASYLRQPMGFQAHTTAGGAASDAFFTAMLLNGEFDRVGIWIEQVDENFLERQGYDPDGDLYKLVQRSNLNPAVSDTTTGLEKKTGDRTNVQSFADLVDGVELPTLAERQQFLRDNIDIAQFINYMAVRSLQQQADDVRKNMYLYQDSLGDGLWRIFPWDLDWTFDVVGGHDNRDSQRTEHPFFGTQDFPTADGFNQWNKLYDVLFESTEIQEMYLRRLRTLMDQFYGATGENSWFADYVNPQFSRIDPHLGSFATNGKNSLLNSVDSRRSELFGLYTRDIPGYTEVIPNTQPMAPQINIEQLEFSPTSGNQDHKYIELHNPNSYAVDISGWTLSGGISHTFQPGTVIAANATLYVTPSVAAFRERSVGPSGGQSRIVQQWTSGHLSNFAEDVVLSSTLGTTVDSATYDGQPSDTQRYLRISEIYYHPEDARTGEPDFEDNTFEFIELTNTSADVTLDLFGVRFTSGIDFAFANGSTLAPGSQTLIVANEAAFVSRFGDAQNMIAGSFLNDTSLSSGGERLNLEDASGSTILDFSYDDESGWPADADGGGKSLEPLEFATDQPASELFEMSSNWRAITPTPGGVGISTQLPGDANADGTVSFADFLILSSNFGRTDAAFASGDFDGNAVVNFADFLLLSANFGRMR